MNSGHATAPTLRLTHGQVVFTLCQGKSPDNAQHRRLLDQLRYLRQLGIPFNERQRGKGRGRPIYYSYDELVEVAVGLSALRRGVRPHLVADYLITNRKDLRRFYRQALEEQAASALDAPWLQHPETAMAMYANEHFLRLHNRMYEAPGTYELIKPEEARGLIDVFGKRELFPDGTTETLIPLTRLVLTLVYWALRAPMFKPGRKPRASHASIPSQVRS